MGALNTEWVSIKLMVDRAGGYGLAARAGQGLDSPPGA